MKMTTCKRKRFRLYFLHPLPVRSLPNLNRLVPAGKEGDNQGQQSHSNGQDEIKEEQAEEVEEVQDNKKHLAAASFRGGLSLKISKYHNGSFFPITSSPGGRYRFISFVARRQQFEKHFKSMRVNKSIMQDIILWARCQVWQSRQRKKKKKSVSKKCDFSAAKTPPPKIKYNWLKKIKFNGLKNHPKIKLLICLYYGLAVLAGIKPPHPAPWPWFWQVLCVLAGIHSILLNIQSLSRILHPPCNPKMDCSLASLFMGLP